jgi:hypothetical protein
MNKHELLLGGSNSVQEGQSCQQGCVCLCRKCVCVCVCVCRKVRATSRGVCV